MKGFLTMSRRNKLTSEFGPVCLWSGSQKSFTLHFSFRSSLLHGCGDSPRKCLSPHWDNTEQLGQRLETALPTQALRTRQLPFSAVHLH